VVIDFIDMILESNREAVLRRLVECLGRDRTKHQVAEVTSLGLVQMTRKRVGQGLIEAFSTTCDSCNGRGIHIHMEPVKMKAPMPQLDTPSSRHEDADEADATAHEYHESLNQSEEKQSSRSADLTDLGSSNDSQDKENAKQDSANSGSDASTDDNTNANAAPKGRKRRRASSSGIITA
jgi:ribonuclease E